MSALASRTVKTAGVTSAVSSGRTRLGHVVMLDLDHVSRETALSAARALAGPAVVCRSSPGSWHVYGLAVASWEVAIETARSSPSSREHVEEMAARGEFTLRTFPKLAPDGEVVASAPEPVAVVGEVAGPVSRPHVESLRQMAEECGRLDVAGDLAALSADVHALGDAHGTAMWAYEVDR